MVDLPNEIMDMVFQNYWSLIYKENIVNRLNEFKYENEKNNKFLEKHIISNIKDVHKNTHLHYYVKNINNSLNNIKKDKGILFFLKIINREKNGNKFESIFLNSIDCYDLIDFEFRMVSKYIITLINPSLRYEAFECLKHMR